MDEFEIKFGISDSTMISMDTICKICGKSFGNHRGATCPRDMKGQNWQRNPYKYPYGSPKRGR